MIEQRGNFIGGEGVSKGEMGWDPPLVEPPTKRYKPIVDYVSLTTCAFEAAMRWCRKSGMLAECQRSYHGEYFLPKTLLLTEFLPKKQPQSPNGQKLFYRQTKNSQVQIIVSGLLKNESCNVQY